MSGQLFFNNFVWSATWEKGWKIISTLLKDIKCFYFPYPSTVEKLVKLENTYDN